MIKLRTESSTQSRSKNINAKEKRAFNEVQVLDFSQTLHQISYKLSRLSMTQQWLFFDQEQLTLLQQNLTPINPYYTRFELYLFSRVHSTLYIQLKYLTE